MINLRNYTLDELSSNAEHQYLGDIGEEFIRRFNSGEMVSSKLMNDGVAEADLEGYDRGYEDAQKLARDEIMEMLEGNKHWLFHEDYRDHWKELLERASTIG